MHPLYTTLMLRALGMISKLGTPPRYMGVWIFRPPDLPATVNLQRAILVEAPGFQAVPLAQGDRLRTAQDSLAWKQRQ
jgi:hypothetical protein